MLSQFDPLVSQWFSAAFAGITEPQRLGWPEIQAGRDVLIGRADALDHLRHRQPVRAQPLLVEDHLDLAHQPARDVDRRDAFDREQLRPQPILDPVPELYQVERVR